MLRTIEAVLGVAPLGLNDAMAASMAEVFDLRQKIWSYRAQAADVLRTTQLPILADRFVAMNATAPRPLHSAAYWAAAMRGQDFRVEDRLDTAAFNTALWRGLGVGPEPVVRGGQDLSEERAVVTAKAAVERDIE